MFQTQSFQSFSSHDGEEGVSEMGLVPTLRLGGAFTAGKHTRTDVRWSETSQQSRTGGAGGVSDRSAPRTALSCFPPAPGLCVGC